MIKRFATKILSVQINTFNQEFRQREEARGFKERNKERKLVLRVAETT